MMFTFADAMVCLFLVLFFAFLALLGLVSIRVTHFITAWLRKRLFLPRHWYFQDCLFSDEWFPYAKMFPLNGDAGNWRGWRKGLYRIAPCKSNFYCNFNPTADGLVLCGWFTFCGPWSTKLLIPWSSLSEPKITTNVPLYKTIFEQEHMAMEIKDTKVTVVVSVDVWQHCLDAKDDVRAPCYPDE